MNDALAAAIAETGATLLRHRWSRAGYNGTVWDEKIVAWIVHERGFTDYDTVRAIWTHVRCALDVREAADRALIRRPPPRACYELIGVGCVGWG